jgi:tripartite-type tricarboxylate transporter receptor subunit TctC
VLAVNAKSNINSVSDLTVHLKTKGSKATYGSPTSISLASAEVYMSAVGVTAQLVRYKSSAQALNDLKAGDIDFFFIDSTAAIGPAKRGDIRALAVTTRQRISAVPDIPTMQEIGIADFDMSSWFGIFVPAKTPTGIRDRLETILNEIVARKATADFLTASGLIRGRDRLPPSWRRSAAKPRPIADCRRRENSTPRSKSTRRTILMAENP